MQAIAIQSSGLRINDDGEARLLEAIKHLGLKHVNFGCLPFTNQLTGWEDFPDEPMFVHCSTRVLKVLTDISINPTEIFEGSEPEKAVRLRQNMLAGIFYDPAAFDQATYIKLPEVRGRLLNGGGRVLPISKVLHEELPYDVFFKPTTDLKAFKGGVVEAGQTLNQFIHAGMVDVSLSKFIKSNGLVLMAQVREIEREYRFFIVDGRVAACSQYLVNGSVKYDSYVPLHLVDQASDWARLYQPARAFTMDLAVLKGGGVRIVEYNCINCSGLYHSDVSRLLGALM